MEPSVDNLAEQFYTKLEMNSTASNVVPTEEKYVSLMQINKDIPRFNGSNIDPSIFLEECYRAYKLIDPFKLPNLGTIIHDKIYGEAKELISKVKHDYHDITLELKRYYLDPKELNWVYEFIKIKQEFYETPVKFGTRLLKMVSYAKVTYMQILPQILADNRMISIKQIAQRVFTTKLTDKDFGEIVRDQISKETMDLECVIKVAENIYNCINKGFLDHSKLYRNEFYCPHCEDSYYHYFDCLYLQK